MNLSLHEGYSLHLAFEILWCSGDTVHIFSSGTTFPGWCGRYLGPKREAVVGESRRSR